MDAAPTTSTSTARSHKTNSQREQHAEHVAARNQPARYRRAQAQRRSHNADNASDVTHPRGPEFVEVRADVKPGHRRADRAASVCREDDPAVVTNEIDERQPNDPKNREKSCEFRAKPGGRATIRSGLHCPPL